MERNEGIVVSGGSLRADQLAVGRHASVTVGAAPGTDPEVVRRLDALLELVEKHAAALSDPAAVRSTAEVLRDEVTKPKPNRITVRGLLAGLTEAVGTVTPLLKAVEGITVVLAALL
jgi:hypothetical protein